MAPDTSRDGNESDSVVTLLAKCSGVGLVLGIVGLVVFVGVTFATGYLWAPVGLIPAAAAGIGVRKVVGRRGGVLTGLVAVVTGQGPVLLLYYVAMSVLGAYSFGQADAVVTMFGFLVAYKIGSGPDGDPVEEGSTSEASAAGEPIDPADVDSEAVAEALEGDDADLEDLADALDQEAAEAEGVPVADAGVGDGPTIRDGETASDWVADDGDGEDEAGVIDDAEDAFDDEGETVDDEGDLGEPRT